MTTLDQYFTTGLSGSITYDDSMSHSPLGIPAILTFRVVYDLEQGERPTSTHPGCAEEVHVRDVTCRAIFADGNDRIPTLSEAHEIGEWFKQEISRRPGLLERMRPVTTNW